MGKKYQIFISSTFKDLADERQDTMRSILDLGHIPSGMEIFPAADVEQFEYIKKIIDECDYYILIIGARYGTIDSTGVSFTEKEYEYAITKEIPVLAFIHGKVEELPIWKSDTEKSLVDRLAAFRTKVSTGRLVRFWQSRDHLRAEVIISLAKAMADMPGVGWIRGDAAASEDLLSQINDLRQQNDELKREAAASVKGHAADIPDIADLDSAYTIRLTTYNPSGADHKRELAMTWREIFRAVGADITAAKWVSQISNSLERYINENRPLNSRVVTIFDTDVKIIKAQLEAYGLLQSFASKNDKGFAGEAIQITDYGRRMLAEDLVIRRKG